MSINNVSFIQHRMAWCPNDQKYDSYQYAFCWAFGPVWQDVCIGWLSKIQVVASPN